MPAGSSVDSSPDLLPELRRSVGAAGEDVRPQLHVCELVKLRPGLAHVSL
ncbi:MAG TPA: hypothetical protein VIL34_06490 [Actinopolymorphaceae bacterium]